VSFGEPVARRPDHRGAVALRGWGEDSSGSGASGASDRVRARPDVGEATVRPCGTATSTSTVTPGANRRGPNAASCQRSPETRRADACGGSRRGRAAEGLGPVRTRGRSQPPARSGPGSDGGAVRTLG